MSFRGPVCILRRRKSETLKIEQENNRPFPKRVLPLSGRLGAVALWLMRSAPDRGVWVQALAETLCLSKRVFVLNHSYENVFSLQVHFQANQTYFYMKGFKRGLILKQRRKVTRKLINISVF